MEKLASILAHKLELNRQTLDNIKKRLNLLNPINVLNKTLREKLIRNKESLYNIVSLKLERSKTTLNEISIKLDLLNPENILKKGYSVTLINGKIISSIKNVKESDKLTTKLKDGIIISEVKECK